MSSVSSNSSFPAMVNFASIDKAVMSDPALSNVISTRFALKSIITTNPYVIACAKEALKTSGIQSTTEPTTGDESARPYAYVARKIEGFGRNSNPLQTRPLTAKEVASVTQAVHSFAEACRAVAANPQAVATMEAHTAARKLFKDEMANTMTEIFSQNTSVSPKEKVLETALALNEEAMKSLNVGEATKDYIRYKHTYVFAYGKLFSQTS